MHEVIALVLAGITADMPWIAIAIASVTVIAAAFMFLGLISQRFVLAVIMMPTMTAMLGLFLASVQALS